MLNLPDYVISAPPGFSHLFPLHLIGISLFLSSFLSQLRPRVENNLPEASKASVQSQILNLGLPVCKLSLSQCAELVHESGDITAEA